MEGYGNENPGAFQPTRPLRGATALALLFSACSLDFNPRAPCGARRFCRVSNAPITEFQPTRPLRGATNKLPDGLQVGDISTHAPLAGRDSKSVQITMHIFAITDKFQMLLHRMPPVRAFCSFLMQENHADFGCEPPKRSLRACASHYKIIGSSGRYVCLQPKCSILFSYFLPK